MYGVFQSIYTLAGPMMDAIESGEQLHACQHTRMTPEPRDTPPRGPIDPALADAYRAAEYEVDAPAGPVVLRVGVPSPALAAQMRAAGAATAALLTAHNPWSVPADPRDNARMQAALEAELSSRGVARLPARNRDPQGAWPPEASVLAFGLASGEADTLARRFGQNAWLRVDAPDAVPVLVFTRPVGDHPPIAPRRPGRAPDREER